MIGAEIRLVQEGYKIGSESDGFINHKIMVEGRKKVIEIPDPKRAPYIVEMFNLRALGAMSDGEIVSRLNAMGYRTKVRNKWDKKHTKVIGRMGGDPLTIKELQKKIQRTIYAGIVCEKWTHHLPIKAQYDGLVSIEIFNAANRGKIYIDYRSEKDIQIFYNHNPEKVVRKKMKRNPLFPYRWFLCPECRKPFLGSVTPGKSKKGFPAYHCARNHPRIGINKKTFEATIENFVTHLKLDPDYLNSLEATFLNKYREREKEIVQNSAAMSRSVAELKTEQVAKLEAIVATQSALVRRKLETEVEELEIQIRNAEAERNKIEITENDIKAFVRDAKHLMEHPSEMLLNTANLRVQEALFGLVFEETPTYDEIVNGTPKLNWIFKLSSDFIPQKSLLVRAEGIGPPTHSV
jgi:site-specific DNA recombinase